jgi:signal transduction histidine kinase
VSVPLLREGAPIGAILLRRAEAVPFTDKQIALLETFADQAAIAIENVRLFKELEARNHDLTEALEQQTATSEILRVISSSPTDLQPVFDSIATSATRLCNASFSLVFRFDGETITLVADDGASLEQREAIRRAYPAPPGRTSLAARAILDRRIIAIADTESSAEYPGIAARARRIGYRSAVSVPMLRGDAAIGTINVVRPEATPFTETQIELLQTFADQAVIAIENVRLFKELQARTAQLSRSVDELTALGDVSRALSSTLDLEAVLSTIVARANQLAGTDACSVWEYDETTEEFSLRATDNLAPDVAATLRRTAVGKGEGAVGRMALTKAPVQIPDIVGEDAYRGPMRELLLRIGTRALLAVPLLNDDRLVGGLTVNRARPGEFPPETIELLQTFATQSALAINNARLFREIEDKGRQLEIASRHKSQFLANMSHELRTPLNAILGYTELIADGIYGEVPERMREVLERVDKSGRHLLGLINDILDLSKIEAGQLTLALGPYVMDGVAQTVATQVAALAADKQLGFETVLADDLPIGHGDERRLTQVLLNLVGNAIKFTDAGQVVVRVTTSSDAYLVSVTDTGPGIAEADREKIFEEFQQADTTRAKAKGGTGLGLAISRRIVEMHGGRLWVESALGEGSTFSFSVPVRVERQVAWP